MAHTTGRPELPSSAAMAAPEPAAAEQELVAGGDARGHRQRPAHRVVRGLEAEPGGGVHGGEPTGQASTRRMANAPAMTDTPWLGDACSLVDAFRSGERTPAEELELVLGAIERSTLNAVLVRRPRPAPAPRPPSADVSQALRRRARSA